MRGQLIAVASLVFFGTASAAAQPRSADDLFHEGTLLFRKGETKAACERFVASYKMDPAPGTLFNLATCHEKEGLLWQARGEFLDFLDRANKVGKADKARPAAQHVAQIEERLPKIHLVFPPRSEVATIAVDGVPLAHELWHEAIPADAGAHTIEFQAPGTVAATRSVTMGSAVSTTDVDVPALQPLPVAPPPAPAAEPSTSSPSPSPTAARSGAPTRTLGFVFGGAGVVALGVGTYFGLHALGLKSDADGACGKANALCSTSMQTSAAEQHLNDARTSAHISDVAIGVGVAAVGAGAYFFINGASRTEPAPGKAALRVLPAMGPSGGGVSLAGAF